MMRGLLSPGLYAAAVRRGAARLRQEVERRSVEAALQGKAGTAAIGPGVKIAGIEGISYGEGLTLQDGCAVTTGPATADTAGGKIVFGDIVRVGRNTRLSAPAGTRLSIGSGVSFNQNTILIGNVTVVAGCIFSANVFASSGDHVFDRHPPWLIRDQDSAVEYASIDRPIEIGEDCWIGWGVAILQGVRIGRGSVLGANCVVTRDVAPYAICGGVPAKPIGARLRFAPPRAISAMCDDHIPYFYRGFRLAQRELAVSRRSGLAYADRDATIVLEGRTQAARLRLELEAAGGPTRFSVRIGGAAAQDATVSGRAAVEVALVGNESDHEGPLRGFTRVELTPRSGSQPWGLVSARLDGDE